MASTTTLAASPPIPVERPAQFRTGGFSLPDDNPRAIALNGDITEGAYSAYQAALRLRPEADTLILNSFGGKVGEALQIARDVHLREFRTAVSTECYSACAYIFMAGTWRSLDEGARLGVHQIYGAPDAAEAQAGFALVFDALREFGVADSVISIMLRTRPDDMHVFSRSEIADFGLVTRPQPTPGSAEAEVAKLDPANTVGGQSLLLEASDSGTTGAVPFSGSVEWSKGTDEMGLPTLIGKASIPARNLAVDVLIRQNSDASLPASHVVEVNFKVRDSFIGGTVAGLPGVLLKNEELGQGTPLVGISTRVSPNSFLFELSASPDDVSANSRLLQSRRFIDLALIYATGKRAIFTLEKDPAAVSLFREVVEVWAPPVDGGRSIIFKTKPSEFVGEKDLQRVVTVRETSPLKDTLLQNGFDEQTYDMVAATLNNVLNSADMPKGAVLRILMGPAKTSDTLLPHRLSIYFPDSSGDLKHAATAALTDRGNYVLGLAPAALRLADGTILGTAQEERLGSDSDKVDRARLN